MLGPIAGGRIDHADENHVPASAAPRAEACVSRKPLLLRTGIYCAVDLAVGEEPSARPAAVPQIHVAFEVHAPKRRPLRDGPDVDIVVLRRSDGKIFSASPEI